MAKRTREKTIAISVVVGIIVLIIVLRFIPLVKPHGNQVKLPAYLDQCVEHGSGTSMHIHPHLSIMIDGQAQVIPANVGIDSFCMRPVHTHDDSGTIHLEFPQARNVMLGDFFTIWGKRFDRNCVLDSCIGSPKPGEGGRRTLKLRVNGKDNTEFERYLMHDKDQIEIILDSK